MEDWRYKIAKKRVKKIKGFYRHLSTWLVFCAFFVFLNIMGHSHNFWAMWPIAGWGLGVAMHAIGVFGMPGLGKNWEEKLMEREMARAEEEAYEKEIRSRNALPQSSGTTYEDSLELKEVRKAWKDSDLV